MEFNLLLILCFLSVSWATSHDTLSPELYWKSKLPNVPIPEAIRDIVTSGSLELKDIIDGKVIPACCYWYFKRKDDVNGDAQKVVGSNFTNYSLTKTTHHRPQDPSLFFFLLQDLKKGTTMELLDLTMSTNMASFLPRQVSESIPFSSAKFPDILKRFSITPDSFDATVLKNSIRGCEDPGIKDEKKTCATSLESMVDFVKTEVGDDVKLISTEVTKGNNRVQRYRVAEVVRRLSKEGDQEVPKTMVTCHRVNYVYAVFYCHTSVKTRAYAVRLVGEDGAELETVAICHTDTSDWNRGHVAFRALGVNPGRTPICHFLPQDHIFWYN